jgi:hypothetical protein
VTTFAAGTPVGGAAPPVGGGVGEPVGALLGALPGSLGRSQAGACQTESAAGTSSTVGIGSANAVTDGCQAGVPGLGPLSSEPGCHRAPRGAGCPSARVESWVRVEPPVRYGAGSLAGALRLGPIGAVTGSAGRSAAAQTDGVVGGGLTRGWVPGRITVGRELASPNAEPVELAELAGGLELGDELGL